MKPLTLAVLWTVLVVVGLSIPGEAVPPREMLPFAADKWVHAGMFLGIGALWLQALPGRTWAVLVGGLVFAVASEIWQSIPMIGRYSDPLDVAADAVGLVVGVALAAWLARRASNDR
ncbi:VanZ family protein [Rubrivirga sp. IMCC45206]|uniref:VanZ family protein n=1 Tax=Rubrivirga sp. IMCC45206 TaxID=3391614 RepID=UPI0039900640